MNPDQLLKENELNVDASMMRDTSMFRREKSYFNQTSIDMGFDFVPFYKVTPHGIGLTYLRDYGMLDFDKSATNRTSIANLSRIFLRRHTIISFFEGIEDVAAGGTSTTRGWDAASTNSGTLTAAIGGMLLDTGTTSASKMLVEAPTATGDVNFDKFPSCSIVAKLSATSAQVVFFGFGDFDTGAAAKYVGFKVDGSSIYGASNDSLGEDLTAALSPVTLTDWNIYSIIMTSARRIDYFINNKLVGSLVTSGSIILPAGTGQMPLQFSITNSAAASKTLTVRSAIFNQDI